MKVFRFIILAILVGLMVFVIWAFLFFRGMKATPDWFVEPTPMPTQLADAILSRAKVKMENAYDGAKPGDVFKFEVDYRALESYMIAHHDQDMEANGVERPQLVKDGDGLRVSMRILTGTLAGAVIHARVTLEVSPDGELVLMAGRIMSGNKAVPSFVIKRLEEELGMPVDRVLLSPADFGVKAKLVKVELGEKDAILTLRKTN